ncbi:hypothetical protein [Profundibacter sp.]
MTRASKILTVSYGTFSCTLEGFDDTLGTMKAIAEYFRDLSSKDRYFGAEPPALDPEALANVASRGANLQVEAKVSESGVHLTPREKPAASAQKQAPSSATMPDLAPKSEIPAQAKQEDVQNTLVVPSSEYDDAQDEALVRSAHVPDNPVLKQETAEPGTESIAAKLRRIRAVVAAKQATSSTSSIFAEDFQPEPEAGQKDNPANEALQNSLAADQPATSKPDQETAAEEAPHALSPSEDEEDDMSITLPDVDFPLEDDFDLDDEDMSVANILDVVEDEEEEPEEDTNSAQDKDETAQVDDIPTETNAEPEDVKPAVRPVHPVRTAPAQPQDSEPETENADQAPIAPALVPDTETIRSTVKGILGKTSLSEDDESELLTQLASIEVEETTSQTSVSLDRGIGAALRADRANRVMNTERGGEDEVALERLLEETNAKLDTNESHRRRSAISHLRAAVAATFADRKLDLGDPDGAGDGAEPYRSALADVVQPKTANSYVEPDDSGVAPLVLATDQRVDIENRAKDGLTLVDAPIDDRDKLIADNTSFADFVNEVGATELPDLMEAAAAYAAYIEGRPHFARPQIMRQVAEFTGKERFNREEGLRSFGQLLRQGKIVKIRRGQFTIADNTRFKPSTPMAGE